MKPSNKPRFRDVRAPGERSTAPGQHVPILLGEVLAALDLRPGQVVVDCTLGFAGHAVELLKRVGPTGKLIALDLDADNLVRTTPTLEAVGHPFAVHHANFAALPTVLAAEGVERVDGVFADLGMSSMQVDDPARGFSFMRDGPLDMRMDRSRGRTAADLLNTLSGEELAAAFRDLGDEPDAEAVAAAIVSHRARTPFARTDELKELVLRAAPVQVIKSPGMGPPHKQRMLPTTRVFQAVRMLVNRERASLQQLLRVLPTILNPGGTACILTFHSGEDRLVKAAFRAGYAAAADEPIRPSEEEKLANPRSRSAKLRWARTHPEGG